MHNYKILEKGQPPNKAKHALIMLHGRNSTALNILQLSDQFCDDTFYIAAPQATNNSWYPNSFMAQDESNEPWLTSAVETVKRLIDETSAYIPISQIYILGFSQGACLALEASSRYAGKYGGIIAFTGGLIGKSLKEENYKGNFEGACVFIGNSDRDPHVPLLRSEESKEIMEKHGAHVTLKVYEGMGHTINEDEIQWVKKYMFNQQ